MYHRTSENKLNIEEYTLIPGRLTFPEYSGTLFNMVLLQVGNPTPNDQTDGKLPSTDCPYLASPQPSVACGDGMTSGHRDMRRWRTTEYGTTDPIPTHQGILSIWRLREKFLKHKFVLVVARFSRVYYLSPDKRCRHAVRFVAQL